MTKTPSMHVRMGSANLSQLVFPDKSIPNFPWEKSGLDNTVVKKIQTKKLITEKRAP